MVPGVELLMTRTKPGTPPRWLVVPVFVAFWKVETKKRSALEMRARARNGRIGVEETRVGLGIEGMICFWLRYLGQCAVLCLALMELEMQGRYPCYFQF